MPRDFKTFTEENKNILNNNTEDTKKYEDILNKYKDMNQNDLMSNLISEASKLKAQGKLDKASLNTLETSLTPFLNEEQQGMLKNIINIINEQK